MKFNLILCVLFDLTNSDLVQKLSVSLIEAQDRRKEDEN